jgi:hypothetical protein
MPVTIGRLTSNVNVVGGTGNMSDDVVEKVIRTVIARLKEEIEFESRFREEREIPERVSDSERF